MHIPAIIAEGTAANLGPHRRKTTALTPSLYESHLDLWVDGDSSAGFWECGVGSFTAVHEDYTEVCQILSGSATIETEMGDILEITAGMTLVTPRGWRGTWHVRSPLRKLFVVIHDRER